MKADWKKDAERIRRVLIYEPDEDFMDMFIFDFSKAGIFIRAIQNEDELIKLLEQHPRLHYSVIQRDCYVEMSRKAKDMLAATKSKIAFVSSTYKDPLIPGARSFTYSYNSRQILDWFEDTKT